VLPAVQAEYYPLYTATGHGRGTGGAPVALHIPLAAPSGLSGGARSQVTGLSCCSSATTLAPSTPPPRPLPWPWPCRYPHAQPSRVRLPASPCLPARRWTTTLSRWPQWMGWVLPPHPADRYGPSHVPTTQHQPWLQTETAPSHGNLNHPHMTSIPLPLAAERLRYTRLGWRRRQRRARRCLGLHPAPQRHRHPVHQDHHSLPRGLLRASPPGSYHVPLQGG
jgi:hypothetical protein